MAKKCRIKNLSTNYYVSQIIRDIKDKNYSIFLITGCRVIYGNKKNAIVFDSYAKAKEVVKHYCRKGKYLLEDL